MSVDELIEQLTLLKQIHPMCGRNPMCKLTKKGNIKKVCGVRRNRRNNRMESAYGIGDFIILEFE